jgi:hypothetical protein
VFMKLLIKYIFVIILVCFDVSCVHCLLQYWYPDPRFIW